MRRFLILTCALLAFVSVATAKTADRNVPELFKRQLTTLHAKSIGPILLPETMPVYNSHKLYADVTVAGHGYELDLGAVQFCHSATACFVAEFSARRGGKPFPGEKIRLRGGVIGHYKSLTCGASCSPPSMDFVQSGFDYTIQANVGTEKTERAIIIAMANSALEHGAR